MPVTAPSSTSGTSAPSRRPFEQLRQADVVHMWRLFRGPARQLARALREAGVAVVFDNDDDMTRVPKGSPAYREMKNAKDQIAAELSAMLRLCNLVTTTGTELAARLRRLGGDTRVVENYPQLPDTIARFDLALAPIADVSFNRVRSNIKVKEYAACGVPWLASAIGPYRGLGEEQGGRLVPDYGWAEALTDLVDDAQARASLAQQAAAWGRTQTVVANVGEWEAVFAEAAERAGRRVSVSSVGRGAAARSAPAPVGAGNGAARARTILPRPIAAPEAAAPAGDGARAKPRRGLLRRRTSR